jgi:glycerate kinase
VRVVIAPDSFGGTLGPVEAAAAIAAGWRCVRPDDALDLIPMSDGGEGLLDALLAGPMADAVVNIEDVADGTGLSVAARWLMAADGTAVIESAEACGLSRIAEARRDPRRATSWGVGQLLDAARTAGATRILVGLGGTATLDGGAGALSGLGFRLTVADGSGLKIGGEDLPRVHAVAPTWVADWSGVSVQLLVDVAEPLAAAPARYGPQKGADAAGIAHAEAGLAAWRAAAEAHLGAAPMLGDQPGTGAAGGLGFGLIAGLGAVLRSGARAVGSAVGLDDALARADLVISGEGRLDATSDAGKVLGWVHGRADAAMVATAAVVGQLAPGVGTAGRMIEVSAPDGPGDDPAAEVAAAARRLATQVDG